MILTPEEIRHNIDLDDCLFGNKEKLYLFSGFFNPPTIAHITVLKEIGKANAKAIVVVNGDGATQRKKGFSFMDAQTRAVIMDNMQNVKFTCIWNDDDTSGCIRIIRPTCVVNGGDRSKPEDCNLKEISVCNELGIECLYGFGGTEKIYSSSQILKRYESYIISKYEQEKKT